MSEQATSEGQAEQTAVQAALSRLDKACDEVVEALQACATHVNAGNLEGDALMLRLHQLSARLMSP